MLGSLGTGKAGHPDWPAAVTRTLPALTLNGVLFAALPIGYAAPAGRQAARCVLRPPAPACPGFFVPATQGGAKTLSAAYVNHAPPERPVARA
jgi:hypothetical protein